MTATGELHGLPFDRATVLDVPPLFLRLQAEDPITRVRTPAGDLGWLLTRHEDVRALFADARLGRTHPDPEGAPRYSESAVLKAATMQNHETEAADHHRMRRVLSHSFGARRMEALRPRIQATVDDLLNRLARQRQPADFHEEFSVSLPVFVICELLGVPYEDRALFRAWSEAIGDLWEGEKAATALASLWQYMEELIQHKRRHPGEDVLSDLLAGRDERGRLAEWEVVRLSAGLLFAGHETTMGRIDYGTLLLLTHPDQRQALQRDPGLAPRAVEEILRLATPGQGVLPRYAHADIEVGGVTIKAGDLVLLGTEPANRDRAAFDEPGRFDITREENPHLAFGHGHHYCMGAGLARVELQTVFATLFQRFPSLQLAVPLEDLQQRAHLLTGGLKALPVTW